MFETVGPQWQEGERRVQELDPATRRLVERVVTQLVAELRRRLGSRFSAQELVELYEGSNRWTMAIAVEVAPGEPLAWEQWVADAAFSRYLRDSVEWPAVPPRPS